MQRKRSLRQTDITTFHLEDQVRILRGRIPYDASHPLQRLAPASLFLMGCPHRCLEIVWDCYPHALCIHHAILWKQTRHDTASTNLAVGSHGEGVESLPVASLHDC